MKKTITLILLYLLIIISLAVVVLRLASHSVEVPEAAPTPGFDVTPAPTPVSTPEPTATPEPTPEPTPSPTPDPYLHVDGGDYLLRYDDPETENYFDYWLFIPDNAQAELPLIVFLHGDGYLDSVDYLKDCGIVTRMKDIYGENFPFILLVPCTRRASWEEGTIPDTLIDLIEETVATYRCDKSRVTLTGHSRGAIGTWYIASTWREVFSCAVPVSCSNDLGLDYERLATLPIKAYVGSGWDDYDRYGNYMKEIVNSINVRGGNAELTILEGLYHGDTEIRAYTQELFEWMIAQKNDHLSSDAS